MGRGWSVNREKPGLQIDTFDVLVVLCFLDGGKDVVQSKVLTDLSADECHNVLFGTLVNLAGEHQGKYGVVLHRDRRGGRGCQSH